SRQDQRVVGNRRVLPVGVANNDALLILLYPCHLTHDYFRVLLIPKDIADWRRNLTGRQYRGCHLVKQRLKQVVIRTVDQDYFRGCLPQSFRGGQSSETAAHDHHLWPLICHGSSLDGTCARLNRTSLISMETISISIFGLRSGPRVYARRLDGK